MMRKALASFLAVLLGCLPAAAQQPGISTPPALVIPAETQFSIVLTAQLSSSENKVGDLLHAQLVAPILAGSQVAVPAGTFLQGRIAQVAQVNDRVQMVLNAVSLAMANGYVVQVPGTVMVQSAIGWWQPSGQGRRGGALAALWMLPVAGMGIGAATGSSTKIVPPSFGSGGQLNPGSMTPSTRGRNVGIGMGVGAGLALLGTLLYVHSHRTTIDYLFVPGSPLDARLTNDLALDSAKAAAAASMAVEVLPMAPRPIPPAAPEGPSGSSGMCPGPEIPGTPATVIPGMPATADSPGTPDIVIPGTPSMPGPMIPCS